ncbi:MAG: hypothetical protein IPK26_00605 [Planctomycetes bacterium]|nr:hypothetical protein [Planctomycetota bacterium]
MTVRVLAVLSVAAGLAAQTITVPPGAGTAEQGSVSVNPFASSNVSGAGVPNRMQVVYDAANFAGITTPVLITRMKFRSNGVAATWAGGSISNMIVEMSTCPVDYLAMTSTFANNHGADRSTVWNNAVTILPGTSTAATNPNPPGGVMFVDLDLASLGTPFSYNPALGDLVIDFQSAGFAGTVTGSVPNCDALSTGALARRSFTNIGQFTATGTTPAANAIVVEFDYAPIGGIYANFTASPRAGGSPLSVTFTDQSSSGAGPITSWAWDFTNDGVDDDFTQNPTFVYPCGTHSVRLTVGDGVNAPVTIVRPNLIVTDEITASFIWSSPSAGTVQFTDTSNPPATAWDWDFNGDNMTDSTLPNPQWTFGDCLPHTVRLNAQRNCGPIATVSNRVVSAITLETQFTGGSVGASNWCNLFDVNVTNAFGLEICGLDVVPNTTATSFPVDIYICPATITGNESVPGVWRKVATGMGGPASSGVRNYLTLDKPIYLAPGTYGFMLHHVPVSSGLQAGQIYSSSGANNYGNADVTISNCKVRGGLFTGTLFTPRIWNGAFYYATCDTSGEASYGVFDLGCAGTQGVARNNLVAAPRLGNTMTAEFTNLPIDAAIVLIGFSRTSSPFGSLPLDLTSFGAPMCLGRVSPDATEFITGTGNVANFNLGIPNIPGLLCGQFYTQALVLDPGINTLNATVSDAAAAVIGN